jgi:hypothetical protein
VFVYARADKQEKFPITIVRYPSITSAMPFFNKRGCVMGMLIDAFKNNMLQSDFFANAKHGLLNFVNKGYEQSMVLHGIHKFSIMYWNTKLRTTTDMEHKLRELVIEAMKDRENKITDTGAMLALPQQKVFSEVVNNSDIRSPWASKKEIERHRKQRS